MACKRQAPELSNIQRQVVELNIMLPMVKQSDTHQKKKRDINLKFLICLNRI